MSASPPSRRRFLPEPVETTTKTHRRFPVEPVETSIRISRRKDEDIKVGILTPAEAVPKRRFLPQPVETSIKSNRIQAVKPPQLPTPEPSPRSPSPVADEVPSKPRRRFAPQLIETSKRSKKAGDTQPATLPTDKTDITPGTNHIYLPRRKFKQQPASVFAVPDNDQLSTSHQSTYHPPFPPRRQGSMKPHLNTRRSTRQDSFQPELEPIMSEENSDELDTERAYDPDGPPSLSDSFTGSSADSMMKLQMARTRESCDDRFSGYLLSLAAKAAEQQLREQALAAFPNSDFREVVEHFYDREVDAGSDDDDGLGVGLLPHEMVGALRRKSTEIGWAAKEMQQHQENLARQREEETHQKVAAEATRPTFRDPFWTNGMTQKGAVVDIQREEELERMRNAASPPMLGADLKFRICPSPKATKFESDQRMDVMPHKREDGGGLWGGYCVAEEKTQYLAPLMRGPQMIETPGSEKNDPFAGAFAEQTSDKKPQTGSAKGVQMLSGIDDRLKSEAAKSKLEASLEQEFDDTFITQVYNYLSLGYPSLARQYDEELSKISKVSQEDLCKEDSKEDVQGHIGLVAGITVAGNDTRCPRWTALRIYILEWARQHPSLSGDASSPSAWGVRARRGSWAI